MSIAQEAEQSELNHLDFEWGWNWASYDYSSKGYFAPTHFDERTGAYKGYEAFAKMIRDKRRDAA
jgi:hypothetical protein